MSLKDLEERPLVRQLRAELDRQKEKNAELKKEINDLSNLVDRQSDLLHRTVAVLRGTPPPDVLWSHHDVPELTRDLRTALERLRDASMDTIAAFNADPMKCIDIEMSIKHAHDVLTRGGK